MYNITCHSSGPGQTLTVKLTMTSCDGAFCTSELYFAGLDQSASGSGTLSYTRDDFPAGTTNFTTSYTTDWIAFGLNGSGTANNKANVTQQIADQVGASSIANDAGAWASWTDGTPTASATCHGYARRQSGGLHNGMAITVTAGPTAQALDVFLGTYNAHGTVVAELSDNSAAPLVLTNSTGGLYHFTFAAGAASKKLTVTFLQSTADGSYDTIGLFGAGLAPLPTP